MLVKGATGITSARWFTDTGEIWSTWLIPHRHLVDFDIDLTLSDMVIILGTFRYTSPTHALSCSQYNADNTCRVKNIDAMMLWDRPRLSLIMVKSTRDPRWSQFIPIFGHHLHWTTLGRVWLSLTRLAMFISGHDIYHMLCGNFAENLKLV